MTRKPRKRIWLLAAAGVGALAIVAMYGDLLASAFERNPVPRSAESVARGKVLFDRHCAACHGPAGRGDGMAVASLPTRPDDLSTLPPPPIFPDGVIVYRIANGVDAMPAWKTVLGKNDIWDLLNFIRSLKVTAPR
jgi:mono/diheme cytochrome c family protein